LAKILLDTNIIIDFFSNGKYANITEKIIEKNQAAVSVITVFELFAGVKNQAHINQREILLNVCTIVVIDELIAKLAAKLYSTLKNKGQLIPNEDLMIAACAINNNYKLFTLNKNHFKRIATLNLA